MTIKPNEKGSLIAEERARLRKSWKRRGGRAPQQSSLKLALYSAISADRALDMLRDLPAESHLLEAMEREGATGLSSALGAGRRPPKEQRLAEIREAGVAYNYARIYLAEEAAARGLKIKAR